MPPKLQRSENNRPSAVSANEPMDESIDQYRSESIDIVKYVDELVSRRMNEEIDKKKEGNIAGVKHDLEEKESTESQSDTIKKFTKDILAKYVYPDGEDTIKNLLDDKKSYAILLQVVRVFKLIIAMMLVPILIFSETKFPDHHLNYVAGIFSVIVGALEAADQAIVRTNKKRLDKINNIMESVGIKYRLPDTTLDDPIGKNHSVVDIQPTFLQK